MMVSKKNQCADCGTEMEFHFSSGNYVCIKCSPDKMKNVLSSDEVKSIDDKKLRKDQEETRHLLDKVISNAPKTAYFITHIDNLVHILRDGILAPNQRPNNYKKISNPSIVRRRDTQIYLPNNDPLNCYAHSYFRPDNAMLYCVLAAKKFKLEDIVIVEIKLDISKTMYVMTRKNAVVCKANDFFFPTMTDFDKNSDLTKTLEFFRETSNMLQMDRWNVDNEDYRLSLKQRFMAECLIKDRFSPEMFESVIVYNNSTKQRVKEILNDSHSTGFLKFSIVSFGRFIGHNGGAIFRIETRKSFFFVGKVGE